MDPFSAYNPKQAGQAEPTIEEIEEQSANELLKWILQNEPKQLEGDDLERFKAAHISGKAFLLKAGDVEFFENECKLSIRPSTVLAALSSKIVGKKQDTSIKHTVVDLHTRKRKSPPYTDKAPLLKRTRVGNSSLIINSELKHFRSASTAFSSLVRKRGQAYFDRTRYIFKLHELDECILFCRPRRFGKTLTVSMLGHYHGLQYIGEHESLYKGLDVQKDIDQRLAEGKDYVKPDNTSS